MLEFGINYVGEAPQTEGEWHINWFVEARRDGKLLSNGKYNSFGSVITFIKSRIIDNKQYRKGVIVT